MKAMNSSVTEKHNVDESRSRGLTIVASLMILFGAAEVVTGFTHNFVGIISTSDVTLATYAGALVGAFYLVAGLLVLIRVKWAAALAILLLGADIIGRVALVLSGLYPVNSFLQILAIVIGTSIAVLFAVYIGWHWKLFR